MGVRIINLKEALRQYLNGSHARFVGMSRWLLAFGLFLFSGAWIIVLADLKVGRFR
jgi:hypothetical protein